MNRFSLFVLRLYSVIAVLCALLVSVERLWPQPDVLAELGVDRCSGNLCMQGIAPGFARWDYHLAEEMEKSLIHVQLGGQPANDATLGSYSGIWMSSRYTGDRNIMLADFVTRYGEPICITYVRSYDVIGSGKGGTEVIKLHYPLVTVVAILPQRIPNASSDSAPFDPHLTVAEVEITNAPYLAYYRSYNCDGINDGHYAGQNHFNAYWRGFASIGNYLSLAATPNGEP